ncbi:TonB-dependent receptor [Lysobacteraceae bacterium NML03-0222]|nr:TonB-dependent receptor [Xanthomonadaceae bacterium NML03-0222]PJK05365.1 TonB-dependent receptor [Xanthomonadaceae bacterium NML71-0210]
MFNTKKQKLTRAIQTALFVSAATLVAGGAFAQSKQEAKSLDTITVTGSRVKRADVEGALPVTVIDRANIEASGDMSVADVLRDTSLASFGNFRPQSGSSAQGLADIDMRGLGASRTLVLVDGRRLPKAPFADSAQDLNAIPMAAVERIEILSDGASAVYGSDAIGGVVNIILRKDYEGAELRAGLGMSKVKGGDTHEYAATFGARSDRGSLIASVSANDRGMVFTRDQIGYTQGFSSYGNNYFEWVANPKFDPGKPEGPDNQRHIRGSLKAVPGFNCSSNGFWLASNGTCSFDFNSVAANEASVKNKGLFARGDYQINDDWSVYMSTMVSKVNTFGRYAPVPTQVTVAEGTPNDIVKGDGLPTILRHRLAAAGNRDTSSDATMTDIVLGFQGRLNDKVDLDFGIRRSNYRYNEFGTGYTVNPLVREAFENGSYDVRNPFGADEAVLSGMKATINRQSLSTVEEVFATANFDVMQLAGGTSGMAFGVEYRKEDYADLYDSLQEAGVIDGSAGNSAAGDRKVTSAFVEWALPFTKSFEATLAGRFDKYSDYGSDFSPKLGLRWQPLQNLTLRGSYGTGFRAPTLSILTQKDSFSAESVTDAVTCAGSANGQCQVDTWSKANPNLGSEQSKQWSVGVAYDPTEWLSVTLDWYNIKVEDRIKSFSVQELVDMEAAGIALPAGLKITRDGAGSIERVDTGYGNQGWLKTDGADLNIRTRFDFAGGRLSNWLNVGYVNRYETDDQVYDGKLGSPKMRANLSNTFSSGPWTFGLSSHYIKGQFGRPFQPKNTDSVAGYVTHDAYISVQTPFNATVTIGANNLTNRYPQLVTVDNRPWNFALYDAYGRTVYFRYVQKF